MADSKKDKEIYADAIRDIRLGDYKRTGNKYWDDLIDGMEHRPNETPVTEYQHYYRILLNIELKWNDLIALNNRLPNNFKWYKLSDGKSKYHQHHKVAGKNNLNYISACGHFEIVYNSCHIIQNQYNNSDDMGTYNYYNPDNQEFYHTCYHVLPYDSLGFDALGPFIIHGYGNTIDNQRIINKIEKGAL